MDRKYDDADIEVFENEKSFEENTDIQSAYVQLMPSVDIAEYSTAFSGVSAAVQKFKEAVYPFVTSLSSSAVKESINYFAECSLSATSCMAKEAADSMSECFTGSMLPTLSALDSIQDSIPSTSAMVESMANTLPEIPQLEIPPTAVESLSETADIVSPFHNVMESVSSVVEAFSEKIQTVQFNIEKIISAIKEAIDFPGIIQRVSESFRNIILPGFCAVKSAAYKIFRYFSFSAGFTLETAFWLWRHRRFYRHAIAAAASYKPKELIRIDTPRPVPFRDISGTIRRTYLMKHQRIGDDTDDSDNDLLFVA